MHSLKVTLKECIIADCVYAPGYALCILIDTPDSFFCKYLFITSCNLEPVVYVILCILFREGPQPDLNSYPLFEWFIQGKNVFEFRQTEKNKIEHLSFRYLHIQKAPEFFHDL